MFKSFRYSASQLWIMSIIGIMMMIESIDTNILNVAVPAMSYSLNVTPLNLKFAITSYLISLSIFIPISGYLADKFGTRVILILSITSFGLFSLLCGLSTSLFQLICFRALQGVAGALLVPVGRLLMLKVFPKQELVKVYLFISMPLLLGPLLAPYLGGLLVSYLDWRFIFYINIPLTLFALLAAMRFVNNYTQETGPFNWPSFIMLTVFLAVTAYWLDTGLQIKNISQHLSYIMVMILTLLMYFIVEFKSTHRLINYNLFSLRTYNLCFLSSAISRISLGARSFVIALYLQIALNISPIESGFLISSMAIGYLLSRIVISHFLKCIRFKKLLSWCNIGTAISTILLCFVHEANFFACLVIISIGFFSAVILLLLNVLCFTDVHQEEYAAATSLNSTTQQLFVAVGVSFAGGSMYVLNNLYGEFSIASFQAIFILIAMITLVAQWPFLRLHDSDGNNLLSSQR